MLRTARFGFAFLLSALVPACTPAPAPSDDAGPIDAARDGAPHDAAARTCFLDADCDDGFYCNGTEACVNGYCARTPIVCNDDIACTADLCIELDHHCVHRPPDMDGDGFGDAHCTDPSGTALGSDCDDHNALVFPGNPEICDAIDQDCDPSTLGGADADHDGALPVACCNPQPDGSTMCGRDCNDMNPSISQLATEICDMIDNDCDTSVDEGVTLMSWPDVDLDGYGDASATPDVVCVVPSSRANQGGDCDDHQLAVHPMATEQCNGVDDDCDGTVDEGATAACAIGGSTMECIGGHCAVTGCAAGHFDCNGLATDGCEASLCDQSNICGVCGNSCGTSARLCGMGQCVLTVSLLASMNGVVIDAITSAPVAGATVTTIDVCPEVTATTIANGTFSLQVRDNYRPRWVRITAPGYPPHVQPLADPTFRIFPSSVVDAWRADPDAAAPASPTRAIFVNSGQDMTVELVHGANIGPGNTYVGGDLGHLVGGWDGNVHMSVQPGRMQVGGFTDLGGGCSSSCSPSYDLWLEGGAVTHISVDFFMCGGIC
jgi:hypothetical protein